MDRVEKRNEFSPLQSLQALSHHRNLVSTIFDIGIKHSSPLAILEQLKPITKEKYRGDLNIERIKSKLQKFRKNKEKFKQEFMTDYDKALDMYHYVPTRVEPDDNKPDFVNQAYSGQNWHLPLHMRGNFLPLFNSMSSGEIAAYLTYAATSYPRVKSRERNMSTIIHNENNENLVCADNSEGQDNLIIPSAGLILPKLTEEEKSSTIGSSLGSFVSLFQSLSKELYLNRAKIQKTNDLEKFQVVQKCEPTTVFRHVQPSSYYPPSLNESFSKSIPCIDSMMYCSFENNSSDRERDDIDFK
eukprot:CAMPEP_0184855114 /NCGR_PEP_ID=MMETSP0580-20130426/437_1 /TAXON_ID=1118495 /ORGANISM="Dactyliosolen fragilissimus" /LENGTH=299 /DNA_ID=CAMNT_0027349541 /DNA_START=435 /DNA_END=1334 /DNA_ORIENTATION=+